MAELRRISEIETHDPECKRCAGTGWVCENHLDRPWEGMTGPGWDTACDCGAGAPCPSCNALALEVTGVPV